MTEIETEIETKIETKSNSTYDNMTENFYLINLNPITFIMNINRIMKLNTLFVGKNKYVYDEICQNHLSNIINIDTSHAILQQSTDSIWFIYLRYYNYDCACKCGESIIRKFEINIHDLPDTNPDLNSSCIILNMEPDKYNDEEYCDKILDEYNDIMYDSITEEIKNFAKINICENQTQYIPSSLELFFKSNLVWFDISKNTCVKLKFYPTTYMSSDSSHPSFMNTCMIIRQDDCFDKQELYYSEVQNYSICCGGGEYTFVQLPDYASMMKYDFWKEREN